MLLYSKEEAEPIKNIILNNY